LKTTEEKRTIRIKIQGYRSADPDPCKNATDPDKNAKDPEHWNPWTPEMKISIYH
jgi:hypothetical protein